jgi:hypothetical protein
MNKLVGTALGAFAHLTPTFPATLGTTPTRPASRQVSVLAVSFASPGGPRPARVEVLADYLSRQLGKARKR